MLLKLVSRAGWVTAGNLVGQACVLLATIWLARVYTPTEFGLLAVVLAISNISVALACLRFDIAIPGADEADARGLVLIAAASTLITAVVATLALWSIDRLGLELVMGQAHAPLIFVTILTAGWFQILSLWLVRAERFREVGILRGGQALTFVGLACIPQVGLLWAQALSMIWGVMVLPLVLAIATRIDIGSIGAVLRQQWRLPVLSLPGATLDVVGYSLIIWVLVTAYGEADAGTYSQLQRLLGGPLMLVSISLGQVMIRQTVDHLGDPPALRRLLRNVSLGLLGLVTVALIAVAWVGAPVLRVLLGEQWVIIPSMALAVTVAVGARAIVSPLSTTLVTLRRFGVGLTWQATYFASAFLLLPLVAHRLDFLSFVSFYALHEVILYMFYLILIWRAAGRPEVR